jgi:hypothetical protein
MIFHAAHAFKPDCAWPSMRPLRAVGIFATLRPSPSDRRSRGIRRRREDYEKGECRPCLCCLLASVLGALGPIFQALSGLDRVSFAFPGGSRPGIGSCSVKIRGRKPFQIEISKMHVARGPWLSAAQLARTAARASAVLGAVDTERQAGVPADSSARQTIGMISRRSPGSRRQSAARVRGRERGSSTETTGPRPLEDSGRRRDGHGLSMSGS